jgi:tetratricopeptide (TPR) repeat protein
VQSILVRSEKYFMPIEHLPPSRMFTEYPQAIRARLLSDYAIHTLTWREIDLVKAYGHEVDAIRNKQLNRNNYATALERRAKHTMDNEKAAAMLDEAIALYEANVREVFEGSGPYERLRILYTQRKQYDKALAVCLAYIRMDSLTVQACGSWAYPDAMEKKLRRFQVWADKLTAKLQKQVSTGGQDS